MGVIAGVCGPNQEIFFHVIQQKTWNGDEAVSFYRGLSHFLKEKYPERKKWVIFEDNDPNGFKTKKAEKVKNSLGLKPIGLPKRSPDLSPLDFAVWDKIVGEKRKSEKNFPTRKQETKKRFIARLKRTAETMGRAFLKKTMRSMRNRLVACHQANGGLFE